jgi:AI-2 transport protein TqsA
MDRPRNLSELQVQTVCLIIITAFAIGMGLYLLRTILVPLMLAVFVAFVLSPILDMQTRILRIPRYLALIITLLLGFAVLSIISGFTVSSITGLANNADRYQAEIESRIHEAWEKLPIDRYKSEEARQFDPASLLPKDLMQWLLDRAAGTFTSMASQGVLVLLFVVFLLLGRTATPRAPVGVGLEIERSVKRYIITKVLLATIMGILIFAILRILRVPFPLAFGALASMLHFIPGVGWIVATLLPVPVVLLSKDISTTTLILAIAIPAAVQFTVGNLIEPKILGDSLDLHPVVILIALIFWGMIWGPIGMLLAAPLTAITKIVLSKIEVTRPLADAFAGRIDGLLPEH